MTFCVNLSTSTTTACATALLTCGTLSTPSRAPPTSHVIRHSKGDYSHHNLSLWPHNSTVLAPLFTTASLHRFDVILDNTGFELFTDLCIADYFTSLYHCQVRFHAKAMPWFVSDVTKEDFGWLIEWMATSGEAALEELHHKWSGYIKEGKWVVEDHPFWSYPHSFHSMQSVAPALYEHLSQADLLLFKGDLNYRKLTGDRRWDYSEKFERSVGEFRPAPLVSLRTLKCDLVLDVPQEVIARETLKDKDWMLYGTHAVVQFLP